MKHPNLMHPDTLRIIPALRIAASLALLCPALAGLAQQAPQPEPGSPNERDVLVLSPFVVTTEKDNGYLASATAASGRLRTELKDVAASVTVLTSEFFDDIGSNDLAAALAFVNGVETDATSDTTGISLSQGFIGGDFGDNNTRIGSIRVRGLGRASATTNFFESTIPANRYNIDRVDFLRGANSILFGLGEPAGLVNSTTKFADLRKNMGRVEFKTDQFGSGRTTLDLSQMLIKNKLAVRAIGYYGDDRYTYKHAFSRDRRLYLTGTYRPFQNTTIKGYVEDASIYGRAPNYRPVQDNVSDYLRWLAEYSKRLSPADLAAAFYWNPSQTGPAGNPPRSVFTTLDGQTVDLGFIRRTFDGRNQAVSLFYDAATNSQVPIYPYIQSLANTTSALGILPNTESAFIRSFVRSSSGDLENVVGGFADPQATDTRIFPWKTVDVSSLPGNWKDINARKFYVNLDQKLTENWFISASAQYERNIYEQYFATIAQTQQVSLDINTNNLDGTPNANFLRPFIYGRSLGAHVDRYNYDYVVQSNFDFDFAKKTRRLGWLGFHRLTGIWTRSERDTLDYQWRAAVANTLPGVYEPTFTPGADRNLYRIYYIGDAIKPGDTGLNFTGIDRLDMTDAIGQSFGYQYWNRTTRRREQADTPLTIGRDDVPTTGKYNTSVNYGFGGSMQSFFWDRKVVSLFGYRVDTVRSYSNLQETRSAADAAARATVPFTLRSRGNYTRVTAPTLENRNVPTATQSLVYHVTPWLRVFGNRSENFNATAVRNDNLFRAIAPQSGVTIDYGFGLTLLDGKLHVKASAFDSQQVGATNGSSNPNLRISGFENTLERAINNYNSQFEEGSPLRLPAYTYIGPGGQLVQGTYSNPNSPATTEDSQSTGADLEVIYNPTKNWRIAFNVSKLKNVRTNVAKEVADYLDARAEYFKSFFDRGLRVDQRTPSSQLLVEAFTTVSNGPGAVHAVDVANEGISNNTVSEYYVTGLTNYTFSTGRLKGFEIGANARWESGKAVGYRNTNRVYNFGGLTNYSAPGADVANPFVGDPIMVVGMKLAYGRKISSKVRWKIQLNVDNLLDNGGVDGFRVDPDGSPVFNIKPPRVYQLSNTFDF